MRSSSSTSASAASSSSTRPRLLQPRLPQPHPHLSSSLGFRDLIFIDSASSLLQPRLPRPQLHLSFSLGFRSLIFIDSASSSAASSSPTSSSCPSSKHFLHLCQANTAFTSIKQMLPAPPSSEHRLRLRQAESSSSSNNFFNIGFRGISFYRLSFTFQTQLLPVKKVIMVGNIWCAQLRNVYIFCTDEEQPRWDIPGNEAHQDLVDIFNATKIWGSSCYTQKYES